MGEGAWGAGRAYPRADDRALLALFNVYRNGEVTLGLDVPLSYNPGDRERPGDSDLRKACVRGGWYPVQ